VIAIFDDISQQRWRRINIIYDDVDVAIIEKISKGCTARWNNIGQPTARSGRDFLKLSAINIAEKLPSS
jgi:hypothetical protein